MKIYDIRDFGAVADGVTMNTQAIQAAIDAANQAGGGKVIVADGTYKTGTIVLKDEVELHLESNATILGSEKCEDYPEHYDAKHVDVPLLPRWRSSCLIFADECKNIALTGRGTIDCNGTHFVEKKEKAFMGWAYTRKSEPTPPRAVFFTGCRDVRIEGVKMINQPSGWSYWIHDCDYVHITGLDICADVNYPNNDGIHINSSRHVTVSDCNITCGDDSIILRANNASLKENKVCEFVTITNCNLTSYACGVRLAWTNDGTIRNCTLSNLVMNDCSLGISLSLPPFKRKNEMDHSSSIGSDVGREATLVENISFSNIVMDKQYGSPISITLSPEECVKVSAVRNLYFNNIHSRGPQWPVFHGREDCPIENIYFNNCTFEQTDGSEFEEGVFHGPVSQNTSEQAPMSFYNIRGLHMNNTTFTA